MAVQIAQFQGGNQFVLCCDFCARPEGGVKCLIASPNGCHICDECVFVCSDIVAERRAATPSEGGE